MAGIYFVRDSKFRFRKGRSTTDAVSELRSLERGANNMAKTYSSVSWTVRKLLTG